MSRLAAKLGKLEMKNPVTVASGTFGLEFKDFYNLENLGAIVTKTITKPPKAGNPTPRLYETEAGLLNSIGLQNPGLEKYINHDLPNYDSINSPLIVSISGSTVDEFAEILSTLDVYDTVKGYEVNVSCPNVENEGLAFGTDPKVVYNLTKKLANLTDKELIVKLSPNVTDIVEIAQAAKEGGADSLALINTLLGMAIDWQTGLSKIKRGVAGYSGSAIKPVAVRMVYQVAKNVDIPILAMGGVCNWKDAMEFFYAGASAIAVGTYSFIEPKAAEMIVNDLTKYFEENDLKLNDVIGKVKF